MKTFIKYTSYCLALGLALGACHQDEISLEADDACAFDPGGKKCLEQNKECETASKGSADFTKFVAIGSSYTAGFQSGALFTAGQDASIPALMAKKFECVGGSATFNQPTIGTPTGYNIFVSPNPMGPVLLGRFLLQGTPPKPKPVVSDGTAIPNPSINPGFVYTGSKTDLNNFAVPAVFLGQALIPETGDWSKAGIDPRFSPFYARFASNPGTSTMLYDMIESLKNNGTFFMNWLGMDDFLLYAVYGGDPTKAPLTPVEFVDANNLGFKYLYTAAMGGLLANPTLKGVVVNFPNIFVMPHFTSVTWNAIPLDAGTAGVLNTNLANPYNQFLQVMVENKVISAPEATLRTLAYIEGQNGILMSDESLTDLEPYMGGPAAGLKFLAKGRQAIPGDIIPLSTGSVLGTAKDNNPQTVWGVSYPVLDQHVIIPAERDQIVAAMQGYNTVVKQVADANPDRVAYADINLSLQNLISGEIKPFANGVTITPNINPPTGIYSEDGLHPNSRGYAFIAGEIIDAINTKFGSTIPKPNIANYGATGLPVNP